MNKKTKTKKKAKAKTSDTDRLYAAVNRFLKINGWNVVVMGPVGVKQDPFAFKYDYEFVVGFTGARRAQKTLSASKE